MLGTGKLLCKCKRRLTSISSAINKWFRKKGKTSDRVLLEKGKNNESYLETIDEYEGNQGIHDRYESFEENYNWHEGFLETLYEFEDNEESHNECESEDESHNECENDEATYKAQEGYVKTRDECERYVETNNIGSYMQADKKLGNYVGTGARYLEIPYEIGSDLEKQKEIESCVETYNRQENCVETDNDGDSHLQTHEEIESDVEAHNESESYLRTYEEIGSDLEAHNESESYLRTYGEIERDGGALKEIESFLRTHGELESDVGAHHEFESYLRKYGEIENDARARNESESYVDDRFLQRHNEVEKVERYLKERKDTKMNAESPSYKYGSVSKHRHENVPKTCKKPDKNKRKKCYNEPLNNNEKYFQADEGDVKKRERCIERHKIDETNIGTHNKSETGVKTKDKCESDVKIQGKCETAQVENSREDFFATNLCPLVWLDAIMGGTSLSLDLLLARKVNINVRHSGLTPLHLAIYFQEEKSVRTLLEHGADIESKDNRGRTPLFLAVSFDLDTIVDLLLENGADVYVQDYQEQHLIQYAIKKRRYTFLRKLIKHEAKLEANLQDHSKSLISRYMHHLSQYVNLHDMTKMIMAETFAISEQELAVYQRDMFVSCESFLRRYIKERTYCVSSQEHVSGVRPIVLNAKLAHGLVFEKIASLAVNNLCGPLSLHLAVETGDFLSTELLLKKGAEVDSKDMFGQTALHIASITHRSNSWQIANLLLEKGADVNVEDNSGNTPLLLASLSDHPDTVQTLLDWGGSILVKGEYDELFAKMCLSEYDLMCSLKGHLIKFKCAKLTMHSNYDYLPIQVRERVDELPGFDTYKFNCIEELNRMKYRIIGQHTFYDIFSKSHDPKIRSNVELKKAVYSGNMYSEFPIYATLLKAKLKKIKWRPAFLELAHVGLPLPLPEEMIREILTYLDVEDMENIIKANL